MCGMWDGCGMWDVGCGMWDVGCVGCGMWDVGCGMWDVGMWDVGCGMWDVGCVGCGMWDVVLHKPIGKRPGTEHFLVGIQRFLGQWTVDQIRIKGGENFFWEITV